MDVNDARLLDRRGFLAAGAAAATIAAAGDLDEAEAARRRRKRRPKKRRRKPKPPPARALPPIGEGGTPTAPAQLATLARQASGDAVTFLDLAAFDANLAIAVGLARAEGWGIRPALKSFQSPGFIGYTLAKLPEPRGMVFHLRVVDRILAEAPRGTDLMLGYPPSPPELERFLATPAPRDGDRVRILVDSLELLDHAARLAPTARRPFEIALQLESGFELSGLRTAEELDAALAAIRSRGLSLTAVVCYDGHAAFNPERSFRQAAKDDAQKRFATWIARLRERGVDPDKLVRNGPASSTMHLWRGAKEPNEISPGAGLLFHGYITGDGYDNQGLQPTLHHASPVHRIAGPGPGVPLVGVTQPGSEREKISCKGGAWPTASGTLSQVVHPPGLEQDDLAGGRGNNQAHFLAPKDLLKRGDYIVFRPKHAGDGIDYFAALIAVREGQVKRVWPTTNRPGLI